MDVQTLAAAIAVAKKINNTEEYVASAVSAWLAEHVDPETGYVVDNTLAVEGAAADSKAAGDAIGALNNKWDARIGEAGYHITSLAAYESANGFIASGGTWTNINSSYKHKYVPIERPGTVTITTASGDDVASFYFAVVKSYSAPVSGVSLDFSSATGFTGRLNQAKGTTKKWTLPSDARGLVIIVLNNSKNCEPTAFDLSVPPVEGDVTAITDKLTYYATPGVTWAAMGDSIAAGYYSYLNDGTPATAIDAEKGWAYKVAQRNNWTLTNLAVGGAGFIDPVNGETPGTADAAQGWYIARHTDFSSYNLVTIAYGINDWKGNAYPVGSKDDEVTEADPTTVMGAMKATIEAIMASNPSCKIIVILPLNCNVGGATKAGNYGRGQERSQTGTLDSFIAAMIDVCDYYGIQYVDMTRQSTVNRENLESLLIDGVHPSEACHELLAHELSKKLTF